MTVDIENEYSEIMVKDYEKIINEIIDEACDYTGCPFEVEVDVLLTDDEVIHQINLEQREIDRATDVLSFPFNEYEEAGNFDQIEETGSFHPETGELMLGDIVISMDHVKAQAEEYGHSMERELAFLVAHSMLHLFGYDHMEDEERKVMEQKQEEILQNRGYTRDK